MQFDIKPALIRCDISLSRNAAIQEVRNLIEYDRDMIDNVNEVLVGKLKGLRDVDRASILVQDIFNIDVKFADYWEAVLTTQALVDNALATDGIVEDGDLALMAAQNRCKSFMEKPANKCMFATKDFAATNQVIEQQDVGLGEDTSVAVNKEGKLKKGEKERIAGELYKKFKAEATDPNDNQAFIQILMDNLSMSKAGATTYNYNMKKKMGGTIIAKPKRAK
jgi:hypothetical protein